MLSLTTSKYTHNCNYKISVDLFSNHPLFQALSEDKMVVKMWLKTSAGFLKGQLTHNDGESNFKFKIFSMIDENGIYMITCLLK